MKTVVLFDNVRPGVRRYYIAGHCDKCEAIFQEESFTFPNFNEPDFCRDCLKEFLVNTPKWEFLQVYHSAYAPPEIKPCEPFKNPLTNQ